MGSFRIGPGSKRRMCFQACVLHVVSAVLPAASPAPGWSRGAACSACALRDFVSSRVGDGELCLVALHCEAVEVEIALVAPLEALAVASVDRVPGLGFEARVRSEAVVDEVTPSTLKDAITGSHVRCQEEAARALWAISAEGSSAVKAMVSEAGAIVRSAAALSRHPAPAAREL